MLPDSSYIAVENIHSGMATTTAGIYLLTHLPVLVGLFGVTTGKVFPAGCYPGMVMKFVFAALLA